MEILDQLEHRLEELLRRVQHLEQENEGLKTQLDEERANREAVRQRIDGLLSRLTGGLESGD